MPDLALLVNLLQLAVKDRTQLALENIALRHQLAIYKRSVKRPNINDTLCGHEGGNPGHGQGQPYGPPRQSSTYRGQPPLLT